MSEAVVLSQAGERLHADAADHVSRPQRTEGVNGLHNQRTGRAWGVGSRCLTFESCRLSSRDWTMLLDAEMRAIRTWQSTTRLTHYMGGVIECMLLTLQ